MTLKVMGAGLGRTGTLSLKFALEERALHRATQQLRSAPPSAEQMAAMGAMRLAAMRQQAFPASA